MKGLSVLVLAVLSSTAAADITVTDNHQRVAVDCAKDPNVTILGNHAGVVLTGTCKQVTLAGNHNTVRGSVARISIPGNHNGATLDAVDAVSVPGNHNTLTYKTAVTPKKKTKVSVPGRFNRVSQAN